MRLTFLRATAVLALFAAGGCAFEPRYPIEAGAAPGRGVVVQQPAYPIDPSPAEPAPRAAFDPAAADALVLMSAVDYVDAAPLPTLASTRHPTLRRRLEADADAAPPASRKHGKASRKGGGDAEASAGGSTVVVQAGDTLYSLAGRNHATVEAVARLNGLKPPYALAPGRTLKLPAPKTYVAKKGDTVGAVADRYGVKESLLRKANPDLAGDTLRRGTRLVLPAAAKDAGADDHPQGSMPAAVASAAPEADAKACPRGRGRRACLAAAKAAQASAPEAAAPAETAAFDLKACRRHASLRSCAAQAKAAQTAAAAAPKAAAPAPAEAAFDLKACRRHNSRSTCAAREKTAAAAAEETATASARTAGADVASAEQALKACRRHHRARACAAQAKAVTEAKAAAPAPTRKDAADAATAALNLKACRRRHSRRDCAAQAAEAPSAPARATRPPATPETDVGASAESMVASLPPAAPTPSARTHTRLSGDTSATPPAATAPSSETARGTAPAVADVSPGPRSYASVFGGRSADRASTRPARDRSGRTSQDAQAAAAAAARRDYARASLPAMPALGGDSASGRPRFSWPVSGEVLSGFGPKGSGLRNDGVDLAASLGDPVRASASGEVVYAGGAIPGFGNLVLVKHPGGWVTAYGHLSKISVAMRQAVRQGDVVGEAGQSGNVLRPELHFEIRFAATPEENAKPVDPAPLLPRRG